MARAHRSEVHEEGETPPFSVGAVIQVHVSWGKNAGAIIEGARIVDVGRNPHFHHLRQWYIDVDFETIAMKKRAEIRFWWNAGDGLYAKDPENAYWIGEKPARKKK
jgi:hypothetical protein